MSEFGKISEATLEKVRSIPIENIVSPYVELTMRGSNEMWGCCPLHNEKTPSFKINLEKNRFHCFGCDEDGDGISFIIKFMSLSYRDAIIYLSEHFGIDVEYEEGIQDKNRKNIISLHEDLQIIFRKYLYEKCGSEAKEYILNRSFSDNDLNDFGIGYIPPYADFSEIFKKYNRDILLSSGFFKSGQGGQIYSRFFNRLSLPIKNVTGSILAFAGRSLDGSNPKYLNSAESNIFHKGKTLFNIDRAKNAAKTSGSIIIVEGYFDVMRLNKAGINNVAAPMGTAFTAEQARLLKNYCDDVTLVFDGDEAGIKASNRSLPILIEAGIFPKAIFLPSGDDPDTFVLREGRSGWDKLFSSRVDLFIELSEKSARSAGDDFNKKLIRFQGVKKLLASVNNPHLLDYYMKQVSHFFGLEPDNVKEDIVKAHYDRISANTSKNTKALSDIDTSYLCEMDFISCLCKLSLDVADNLLSDMSEGMFRNLLLRRIFKKILEEYNKIADIKDLIQYFDAELSEKFAEILLREISGDVYLAALTNKRHIVNKYLISRKSILSEELKNAPEDRKFLILTEINDIARKISMDSNHKENNL